MMEYVIYLDKFVHDLTSRLHDWNYGLDSRSYTKFILPPVGEWTLFISI